MNISTVRLYHPAPWGWLYSYRAILLTLRMMELGFIIVRYMFFRAPVLIAWTRLPGLRDRRPPFSSSLAEVMAPLKQRPSLYMGGGQLGSDLGHVEGIGDAASLMSAVRAEQASPMRLWSVLGCVLRGLFTDLGSAFIKFGQILSMREEVPPVLKREFAMLQDKLPPMRYREITRILERELDRPVKEVFEWVEEKPIAAASLSQVHRAKLRKEQEEVALKIQRPYLSATVVLDTVIICDIFLGLIKLMLPLLNKSTDVGLFTTSYRDSLNEETQFVLEARNQERFRKLVMKHPIFSQCTLVARTYPQYCTTKLIVMELVQDYYRLDRLMDDLTPQQLWEFADTKIEGYPRDLPMQLVFSLVSLGITGLLDWGFSHGDMHLGNFYALAPQKEGDHWKIFGYC